MTDNAAPQGAEIDTASLLAGVDLVEVAGRYVELRKAGSEYAGLCPFHGEKTPSFRVVPNKGFYHCFGCGAHGDAIDLVQQLDGCTFREACERLGARVMPGARVKPQRAPEPERVTSKPPAGVRAPDMGTRRFGEPVRVWEYRNAAGDLLGYVARYEYTEDGRRKKLTPQWTWGAKPGEQPRWGMGHWNRPRPLYGLDRLAARPDAPVLICEGEKATDAGGKLLPAYVAASWPGGVNAIKHADWQPMAGRNCVLWPDADDPGRQGAEEIARILHGLGCRVRVVDTSDQADGWDLADALAAGWNNARVMQYARARIRDWEPAQEPAADGPPPMPEPPPEAYEEDARQEPADSQPPAGNVVPMRYRTHLEVVNHPLQAEPWGEPADLFAEIAIPRLQPEWLPSVIADYVFDQAEIVGTDPEIMALSCIVACAGAADDRITLQPAQHNQGWQESPRLWGAIVGDPSIKKSPAVSRAVSRLRKLDIDLAQHEAQALAKHALATKVYDKAEKAYIEAAAKGEDAQPPTRPEQPEIQRLLVEDVTVEALSEILKLNPRGVLCLADELSGWFGAMDAYKNGGSSKDRAHWLEIYNGGPRRIDRVARGKILVPNWSACMLGGIQPDTIRRVFKETPADGLLQRFMVVIGTTGKPGVDRLPNIDAQNAYRDLVEQIFSIRPNFSPIQLSHEAKVLHDEIVNFAYEMISLRVLPAALCSHLGKWEGLAPRLMLTFHIIEAAAAHRYPAGEIDGETAQRVRDFMVRFLFRHALAFYSDVLGDNGYTEAVRWIGGYILAKGEPVLKNRDLLRDYGWWKQASEWQRSVVMQRLVEFEWVRGDREERDRFKALPTSMSINPSVFIAFSSIGEQEKRRRAAVKRILAGDGSDA